MIFLPTFGFNETFCFAVESENVNLPGSFQIKGSKDLKAQIYVERY